MYSKKKNIHMTIIINICSLNKNKKTSINICYSFRFRDKLNNTFLLIQYIHIFNFIHKCTLKRYASGFRN